MRRETADWQPAKQHPCAVKLAQAWPPECWQEVTVVVAVSGGADSVALLRALTALKRDGRGRLLAAHFNHRLRAEESDADEAWVVQLCRQWAVPCQRGHADPDAFRASGGEGREAAARQARYQFLQDTAQRCGARYLVTAHTADDQAETLVHRIMRGTGLGGLAGIPRVRPLSPVLALIRPLLDFRRAELIQYLQDLGQPSRQDSTNLDLRFTRNRIRHDLLPRLQADYNEQVVEALCRLGTLSGEAQAVIDALVAERREQCVRFSGTRVEIDCPPLRGEPRYLVRELLIAVWKNRRWPQQAMGYDQWQELAALVQQDSSLPGPIKLKKIFPGGVSAEKQGDLLYLNQPS